MKKENLTEKDYKEVYKIVNNGKRIVIKAGGSYLNTLLASGYKEVSNLTTKDSFLAKKFDDWTIAGLVELAGELNVKHDKKPLKAELYNSILNYYDGIKG